MENQQLTIKEKKEKTEQALSNIYTLPSMPSIMIELSKLLKKPNSTANEMAQIILKDPGLTSKILSIANSPLYGLPRKITTVEFAILIIGLDEIKNIVTALTMIDSFKSKSDNNLNQKEFWAHSLICGLLCKKIAEDVGCSSSGEAFIAALIHDLGIPVIHKYFLTNFIVISEMNASQGMFFPEAEKEVLGLTHQEIGKFLAVKWNLPSLLCDTILYHHKPSEAKEEQTLASLVHIADYATQKLNFGAFYWDKDFQLDPVVLEMYKFRDQNQLDEFILRYKDVVEEHINLPGF